MKQCLILLSMLALLAGCSQPYTVTFNERVIHATNGAGDGGLLTDANLQGCLNQALLGSDDEDPASVTLMACPSAGIESLAGIEALSDLEQLELSNNRINDLAPLAGLDKLRVLSLRNNDIRNIGPLMDLPLLRFVSLQGNSRIPCRQLDALEEKLGNTLTRPANCGE